MHAKNLITTGIFAVTVSNASMQLNKAKGVASIGVRPSVADSRACLEVHIFECDLNLYGLEIEVTLLHKLRNETKFDDLNKLRQQIERDKHQAVEYFNTHSLQAC